MSLNVITVNVISLFVLMCFFGECNRNSPCCILEWPPTSCWRRSRSWFATTDRSSPGFDEGKSIRPFLGNTNKVANQGWQKSIAKDVVLTSFWSVLELTDTKIQNFDDFCNVYRNIFWKVTLPNPNLRHVFHVKFAVFFGGKHNTLTRIFH